MFLTIGCQKEFLEKKPNKALLVPVLPEDFRNLLDNLDVFNIAPALTVISADNYYADDIAIDGFYLPVEKNAYLWAHDIDEGLPLSDWNVPYQQVFYSNVILDGLERLKEEKLSVPEHDEIKGSALFHRAFAFYNLVQLFSSHYNERRSEELPGIPLKLSSDVNIRSKRSSLKDTYAQIMKDLGESKDLLPFESDFPSRPNKRAALALLARINLNIGNYEKAFEYSDACLRLNGDLIDYNFLDRSVPNPFPASPVDENPEIIFYARLISYSFTISIRTTVNNSFYQTYASEDLRKHLFFNDANQHKYFKGRYTGSNLQLFGGITNSEMYLIRAECFARLGKVKEALGDINTLLVNRFESDFFEPLVAFTADDALDIVIDERRKELVFRGIRWSDLRRLNMDERFAKTISRSYHNTTYNLHPNSKNYTLPIPLEEMISNTMEQNERE